MAICEELHFTRAAEKLGVSAPNISQQIRRLEEELGVLLFDRVGKTIVLTDAGAILREHGAAVFRHLQQAGDAIADLKQMQGGSLSIGVLPGDADLMFNAMLLNFHQTYPPSHCPFGNHESNRTSPGSKHRCGRNHWTCYR